MELQVKAFISSYESRRCQLLIVQVRTSARLDGREGACTNDEKKGNSEVKASGHFRKSLKVQWLLNPLWSYWNVLKDVCLLVVSCTLFFNFHRTKRWKKRKKENKGKCDWFLSGFESWRYLRENIPQREDLHVNNKIENRPFRPFGNSQVDFADFQFFADLFQFFADHFLFFADLF